MKPGIQTTEMWMTVVTLLGSVIGVAQGAIPETSVWAVVLGGAATLVTYIISRMYVKSKE